MSIAQLERDVQSTMTSRVIPHSLLIIFALTFISFQIHVHAAVISSTSDIVEMAPSLLKSLKIFSSSASSSSCDKQQEKPTNMASTTSNTFWMEKIKHQGLSPFNPNSKTYKVFRNVKVRILRHLLSRSLIMPVNLGLWCRGRWHT